MRLVLTLMMLCLAVPAVARDSVESHFTRYVEFTLIQDHERALREIVALVRLTDFEETGTDPSPAELIFYDVGMALMQLSRWQEAKYCFSRVIIAGASDLELKRTFGTWFSRENWFKENRLENQPFWNESKSG